MHAKHPVLPPPKTCAFDQPTDRKKETDMNPNQSTESYFQLRLAVLDSPAFLSLGHADRSMYLTFAAQLSNRENGKLTMTMSDAAKGGIKSTDTVARSLRALKAVGLVAPTTVNVLPIKYRLTDRPVDDQPATHDWKRIKTVAEGKVAIEKAREKV